MVDDYFEYFSFNTETGEEECVTVDKWKDVEDVESVGDIKGEEIYTFEIKEDFANLVWKLRKCMAVGKIKEASDGLSDHPNFKIMRTRDSITMSQFYVDDILDTEFPYRDDQKVSIDEENKEICLFNRVISMNSSSVSQCGQLTIKPKEGGGCVAIGDIARELLMVRLCEEDFDEPGSWSGYYDTLSAPDLLQIVNEEMTYVPGSFAKKEGKDWQLDSKEDELFLFDQEEFEKLEKERKVNPKSRANNILMRQHGRY